jgi:hypothetical protein
MAFQGDQSGAEETKETTAERRQRRMKEKLERAKLRKKALFDMEYDDKGDGEKKTYFEEWKAEMEVQAKVRNSFSTPFLTCMFALLLYCS